MRIGITEGAGANLVAIQGVRPGGPGVMVTITSSNPAAGGFVSGATTVASVIMPINPGQGQTGNAFFRPLAVGSTEVLASAPNVITTGAGRVNVTVTP